MTAVERSSLSNGIWLCQSCSVVIDRDPVSYSETTLHAWRRMAEQRGREARFSKGIRTSADTSDMTLCPALIAVDLPIALDGSPAPDVNVKILGKRLAVHLAKREHFEVLPSFACVNHVQPDDSGIHTGAMDSFELEQFKWHLRSKAAHLVRSTNILFSDVSRDAWSSLLTNLDEWSTAFLGMISLFRDQRHHGTKLDLWSTHEQHIIGAVYLDDGDLKHVLSQVGFPNPPTDLMMLAGVPLGGADLLSSDQQVNQAIPRIAYELGRYTSQVSGVEALATKKWLLGLG